MHNRAAQGQYAWIEPLVSKIPQESYRICHEIGYYLQKKEKERNQMQLKVESMYLVARLVWCSFMLVVVILFLLSLSLVSLKSSSSLPS